MSSRAILTMARAHLANPIVRALLRSRAHRLLSNSLLLLEYTGRRTRNRYALPVGYVRSDVDGDLIVVAGQHDTKTWWRNFDTLPQEVTLQLCGHPAHASARLLKGGTDERIQAVCTYQTRLPRARIGSAAPVLLLTPVG